MEDSFGPRPTDRVGDYGGGNSSSKSYGIRHLRLGRVFRRKNNEHRVGIEDKLDDSAPEGTLGMVDGVYFRVMGNLFGVILFLRMGWMVGYGGVWLAASVVIISSSLTMATALSLSAICTNGKIAAGGAYYLISRSLGPEFGASIGVLYYVANSIAVSLYMLGFAETVVEQMSSNWISEEWDLRLIAFLGLIVIQLICLVGVNVVVKVEKIMLLVLLSTLVVFVVGVFIGPKEGVAEYGFHSLSIGENNVADFQAISNPIPTNVAYLNVTNFTSYNQCTPRADQVAKEYSGTVGFGVLLSIFFPAVTGIMAGANISGDLKDPSWAIPTGTIAAIISAAVVYVLLCFIFAGAFYRITIVGATPLVSNPDLFTCQYGGLIFDYVLIAKASAWPPYIYFGIYAAALSSGLSCLLGAPRILQALARDKLFSMLDIFASGYGRSQEPLRAYAATFAIVTLCILTGDMNTVAPLITTFYLSSYALVNYACYSAEESKSPGWRPTFRYFSKWLAFAGALGCISMMLFLSAVLGFVTFTIGLGLYKYVEVATREGLAAASNWGPHKEAAEYNTALRSALRLEEKIITSSASKSLADQYRELDLQNSHPGPHASNSLTTNLAADDALHQHPDATHVKNYRPQCLVLAGPPNARPALAVMANGFKGARGVTVFGDVLIGDLADPELLKLRAVRAGVSYVAKYGINAFNDVMIAPSFRDGCRSLMQLSGLGRRMRVNVVLMGFLDNWKIPMNQRIQARQHSKNAEFGVPPSVSDFVGVIGDAFDLGLGVAIFRGETDLLSSEYLMETVRQEMDTLLALGLGSNGAKRRDGYAPTIGTHASTDDVNIEMTTKPGRKSTKRIDVWWLVDDGGLTIVLPHVLRQAKSPPWDGSEIRVLAIGATQEEADREERDMNALLGKLRIEATVQVFSLDTLKEDDDEDGEVPMESVDFQERGEFLSNNEVQRNLFRTYSSVGENENRSRRANYRTVGKLITEQSADALLCVVSLPVPPMSLDPEEYMRWLDLLSKDSEAPVLMVRGCERDVVTMYS